MKAINCTLIKPLTCTESEDVKSIAQILRDNKQRRVIVVDSKKYPVGIVSTTDINNRVVAEGKDAIKTKAKEVMTSPLYLVCDVNDEVNEIFHKMVKHESFFVPVTKSKKIYGILTYGELLKSAQKAITYGKNKT